MRIKQEGRRTRRPSVISVSLPIKLDRWVPRGRNETIAIAGFLYITGRWERQVKALYQYLVGRSHVVKLLARRDCGWFVRIKHEFPIRIAHEECTGTRGNICLDDQRVVAGRDNVRVVAVRVTRGKHSGNSGHELLFVLILRYLVSERSEDALGVRHLSLCDFWQLADVALVHPESPLDLRYHYFRVREHRLVVGPDQTVDVVAMEVRDDHGIDVVRVDPRGFQIRLVLAEL